MLPAIIFVRIQSLDWMSLSVDYRLGIPINPQRYMPDHPIPGFPEQADQLTAQWNMRFTIVFFAFRAVLSSLSQNNISAVQNSLAIYYEQIEKIPTFGEHTGAYIYFHDDDDDFFAPDLGKIIRACERGSDAIVTPLFRIGTETFNFVREDSTTDFILVRRKPHDFRYQTNNYGLHIRHFPTITHCLAQKDHVQASQYAEDAGYRDCVLPSVSSATIKTPASASMLPAVFLDSTNPKRIFGQFIDTLSGLHLPTNTNGYACPPRKSYGSPNTLLMAKITMRYSCCCSNPTTPWKQNINPYLSFINGNHPHGTNRNISVL